MDRQTRKMKQRAAGLRGPKGTPYARVGLRLPATTGEAFFAPREMSDAIQVARLITSGAITARVCSECAAYLRDEYARDIAAGWVRILAIYSARRSARAVAAHRSSDGRFA